MDNKDNINKSVRPPIVVVLGHVDHGKTSLLDAIRKTNVVGKEAGGITQKIGASQVVTKDGKRITFIDTPGHAAFSNMRSRGAKVADIAILVVSCDDGVQPQTKEAIKHIQDAGIPVIVAVSKVDIAPDQVHSVLGQIEKEGLLLEKRGGDTPWVEISAKMGTGIDELLDLISLLSEVNGISGDKDASLEAAVIESSKDKSGCVASVVVRNGHIKVGDTIYFDGQDCKVRNLIGETGMVKEIFPGEAARILGFETLPQVGMRITDSPVGEDKKDNVSEKKVKLEKGELGVILKASNAGALEAINANLPEKVVVFGSSVGDIFESDILEAKSLDASIFAFESKVSPAIKKLAESEGVIVHAYNIIYELFDELKDILKKGETVIYGKAQVIASFPFDGKKVAGCKILTGRIVKSDKLALMRGEVELGRVKAISIKKGREEINEARQGEECGILFVPQLDFTMGDVILAVSK
jgi:translation initiation factor IF-2